jgi:hypothetical protein
MCKKHWKKCKKPKRNSRSTGLSNDKSISVGCASRTTIAATPYKNHVMLNYPLLIPGRTFLPPKTAPTGLRRFLPPKTAPYGLAALLAAKDSTLRACSASGMVATSGKVCFIV